MDDRPREPEPVPIATADGVDDRPREPEPAPRTTVSDLIKPFDQGKVPWQQLKYSAENALWQGAAQRRRAHPRRTNVSLGVCSVDLAGPFEPTPRPGKPLHKHPCHYFLVLTVRPDFSAQTHDVAIQATTETDQGVPPLVPA